MCGYSVTTDWLLQRGLAHGLEADEDGTKVFNTISAAIMDIMNKGQLLTK